MQLPNGIETIELGATAWRIIINANFEKIYTKEEIEKKISSIFDFTPTPDSRNPAGNAQILPTAPLPPNQPSGFIKIKVNGVDKKIPFYDA